MDAPIKIVYEIVESEAGKLRDKGEIDKANGMYRAASIIRAAEYIERIHSQAIHDNAAEGKEYIAPSADMDCIKCSSGYEDLILKIYNKRK